MRVPHAIVRAEERYKIVLTKKDLDAINAQCAMGQGRLRKMRDGSEHHLCSHEGQAIIAVYRPLTKMVVTILPREACLSGNDFSPATRFKLYVRGGGKAPKSRRKTKGF